VSEEQWRPVVGWESLYEVSSHGRVCSLARVVVRRNARVYTIPRRMLRGTMSLGYVVVSLCRAGVIDRQRVHRLVANAFLGDTGKMFVLHKDGNPHNNAVSNLRIGTAAENSLDMVQHGKSTRGVRHPMVKLTEEDVLRIRRMDGSRTGIAKQFGICRQTVSDIKALKRWSWLKAA
jgi:hypothetical protein